jgi:DNA-binding CsgD family transcriptional regulator
MDAGAPVIEEAIWGMIDRIYQAVEQPELWPETIEAIGQLIGGRTDFWTVNSALARLDMNSRAAEAGCHGTFFLSRADLHALDQYAVEFENLIFRFLKLVFLSVLWTQKEIGAREIVGLRMTRRYIQEFEASRSAAGAGRHLIAALWEDGRMFSASNLHLMRLLAPHLDRAVRLQMRLNVANLHTELISGALDQLTLGVIFLDQTGRRVWQNKRATEIAKHPNALNFSGTGMIGCKASGTQSLRELVSRVIRAGQTGLLAINRDAGSRPLLLVAMPLRAGNKHEHFDSGDSRAHVVIFITDPDRSDNFTVESLRRAFDLTHREAQMAIAIAQGQGLKMAARTTGVAVTTARSQLQQVFGKTGTNHQAELVALVHRTLTHLRQD